VGMVLAAFLFIRRMASVTEVSAVTDALTVGDDERDPYDVDPDGVRGRAIPPGVDVYEINGPFFFGAAETFRETIGQVAHSPRVLIVRMRHVHALDSTGMHVLADLARRSRQAGSTLLLAEVHAQPRAALSASPVLDAIGAENVVGAFDEALERARAIVAARSAAA